MQCLPSERRHTHTHTHTKPSVDAGNFNTKLWGSTEEISARMQQNAAQETQETERSESMHTGHPVLLLCRSNSVPALVSMGPGWDEPPILGL